MRNVSIRVAEEEGQSKAHERGEDDDEEPDDDPLAVGAVRRSICADQPLVRRTNLGPTAQRHADSQPDHLPNRPLRPADTDIRLLQVLVRIHQLHPLPNQASQHTLSNLLVLERKSVRVVEPRGGGGEGLRRAEEARALGGGVRERGFGVGVVVV